MAAKRRVPKGLATATLCVLAHEGSASVGWLAGRFGMAPSTMDRVVESLIRRGMAHYSIMHGQRPAITTRGYSAVAGRCPQAYHEVLRETRSLNQAARAQGWPEPPGRGPLPGGLWGAGR